MRNERQIRDSERYTNPEKYTKHCLVDSCNLQMFVEVQCAACLIVFANILVSHALGQAFVQHAFFGPQVVGMTPLPRGVPDALAQRSLRRNSF